MLKLVLWDWEGTLVSTSAPIYFYLQKIVAKYGLDFELYKNLDASVSTLTKSQLEELKNLVRADQEWFIPQAWVLVEKFNKENIKQAIISNGSCKDILKKLEFAQFKDFIYVLGADSGFNLKPHPEMVEFVLEKSKIRKDEVIFIGDSESDLVCAKNARIRFIKVDGIESYERCLQFLQEHNI